MYGYCLICCTSTTLVKVVGVYMLYYPYYLPFINTQHLVSIMTERRVFIKIVDEKEFTKSKNTFFKDVSSVLNHFNTADVLLNITIHVMYVHHVERTLKSPIVIAGPSN